jgi:hypothetical protein
MDEGWWPKKTRIGKPMGLTYEAFYLLVIEINRLHGVISQNVELFITTAARTSDHK